MVAAYLCGLAEINNGNPTAIIETGRLLVQAKDCLEHGQWLEMVRAELPFAERTAQRLMAIARGQDK
jgi:hypothetical protein